MTGRDVHCKYQERKIRREGSSCSGYQLAQLTDEPSEGVTGARAPSDPRIATARGI
jgi:hypothetical protein